MSSNFFFNRKIINTFGRNKLIIPYPLNLNNMMVGNKVGKLKLLFTKSSCVLRMPLINSNKVYTKNEQKSNSII